MKSHHRWIVLSAWGLVAASSQLLWLSFAPIITVVQSKFNVSEFQAGLLILVFPLVYVILAIPSGKYIDKHGYRKGVGLGVIVMVLFSWVRCFDGSFNTLLIAQVGIAAAQPYIINGISKLVLDWFDKSQEAIATGLGTIAMFMGMAVGMAASPIIVRHYDIHGTSVIFAVFATVSAILFFAFVKKNPDAITHEAEPTPSTIAELFQNKNLVKLFLFSFLGLGFFNGLTTWLELILAPHGITSEQSGIAGSVFILVGIVGAAVVPAFSDYYKKRKPFFSFCTFLVVLTIYPLCNSGTYAHVLIFSALSGFFFLPVFSLLLEMCAESVGKADAASATGILMLLGNLGGVIVVIAMQVVKGDSPNFDAGVHLMFALALAAFLVTLWVRETRTS